MLMSKSQLHPVTIPAAAGGKRMATYSPEWVSSYLKHSPNVMIAAYKDEDNVGRLDHGEEWDVVEV